MLKNNTTYVVIICDEEESILDVKYDICVAFGIDPSLVEIQGNEILIPILKGQKYHFSLNDLEEFVSPRILNAFDVIYQESTEGDQYRVNPVRCWHYWKKGG